MEEQTFEEEGKMKQVTDLSRDNFSKFCFHYHYDFDMGQYLKNDTILQNQ